MEEFKKPERLVIDAIPYLTEIMGTGLIKDLQEGDVVCPECHGTGLAVYDAPYGLSNDPNRSKMFPYKHQTISSCKKCYNGVLHACQYCGKILDRRYNTCDCDGVMSERKQKEIKKEQVIFDKAIKLNADDEIVKNMGMYYSDQYGYNEGYFTDWDELFDYLEDTENHPEYVWGTSERKISIDADHIIQNVVEDLWEEARDNISSDDENELQEFLDKWCEKQTGTTIYEVDFKYAIKIPWEDVPEGRAVCPVCDKS